MTDASGRMQTCRRACGARLPTTCEQAARRDVNFRKYTCDGVLHMDWSQLHSMFTPPPRMLLKSPDDQDLTNGAGALCERLDKATPCQLGSPARVFSLGKRPQTGWATTTER